jgi:hypothetical protein
MVNRYQDMLASIPAGEFYASDGEVLPYRDAPYEFQFETQQPAGTRFLVHFNDVLGQDVYADAKGVALVRTPPKLEPGRYHIKIRTPGTNIGLDTVISIRNSATWMAAHADVLEVLDAEIDELDQARTLATVTPRYIYDVYGKAVRQPPPEGFLHADYRDLLAQLRRAYRQFGGLPRGLEQAITAYTSVTPFIVPKAWRPRWVPRFNLLDNGDFQTRSRTATQQFAIAGAAFSTPVQDLYWLNRQSRVYVHPGVSGSTPTILGIRNPPTPQRLSVSFDSSGARLVLTGSDVNGVAFTEVVPDYSVTPILLVSYASQKIVTSVISLAVLGSETTNAAVGLAESRFLHLRHVNDYVSRTGVDAGSLRYLGYDAVASKAKVRWESANETLAGVERITLRDKEHNAKALGTVDTALDDFNLGPHGGGGGNPALFFDRLYLEIDERGVLEIKVTSSTTSAANVVADINAAFFADPRYGADYDEVAKVYDSAVLVESPTFGPASSVRVWGGPADASTRVLGLPRSSTHVVVYSAPTNSLTCTSTEFFPDVATVDPPHKQFKIRIRGPLGLTNNGTAMLSGTLRQAYLVNGSWVTSSVPLAGYNLYIRLTSSDYQFTVSDIGGYVYLSSFAPTFATTQNGLHQIIATVSNRAILSPVKMGTLLPHNNTELSGIFMYWPKGRVHTVTNHDRTNNTLTLAEPMTPLALGSAHVTQHSIVELVDETPYAVRGTLGLGELTVDVAPTLRPWHDFGDSLSVTAGTVTLTCSRADFSAVNQYTLIRIEGCQNIENNGVFAITSVTPTTLTFTNVDAINETSQFEWSIDRVEIGEIEDTLEVYGNSLPDGWRLRRVDGDSEIVDINGHLATLSNALPESEHNAPGLLVPSRVHVNGGQDEPWYLECSAPRALGYRGLPLEVSVWYQDPSAISLDVAFEIQVSFDGVGFHAVASRVFPPETPDIQELVDSGMQVLAAQTPRRLRGTFFVPYDATTCVLRLVRPYISDDYTSFILEKATLRMAYGSRHIPRSAKRAKFGEVLYLWSTDALTLSDKRSLGLPEGAGSLPSRAGHVDYLTNAHGHWDRVTLSELVATGTEVTRQNIHGVYDSIEWLDLETADRLVNLEAIIGTPSRTSYARPTRLTQVLRDPLTMVDGGDGPGTARATLTQDTNHEGPYPQVPNTGLGTRAHLYEIRDTDIVVTMPNGEVHAIPAGTPIPLPDRPDEDLVQPWEFTAANQVRVNAPYFSATAQYVLDYEVPMQVTTQPFQLETLSSNSANYLWLVDCALTRRYDCTETAHPREEQITLDANLEAQLRFRADVAQNATLERDNGREVEVLSPDEWEFLDSSRVRLQDSAFVVDAIYVLKYMGRTLNVEAPVEFDVEYRIGDSSETVELATWQPVTNNQVVSPVFGAPGPGVNVAENHVMPWHQLRVTFKNVTDVRDFQLYGLGLKGIRLFQASSVEPGPYAPGIVLASE